MSNVGKTRLKGHALVAGRARFGFMGPAECTCGEKSPAFAFDADRKRWHKKHKAEVIAQLEKKARGEA